MEVDSKSPKEEIKAEEKSLCEFRSACAEGEFDFYCRLLRRERLDLHTPQRVAGCYGLGEYSLKTTEQNP